jgi:hypothetical protein
VLLLIEISNKFYYSSIVIHFVSIGKGDKKPNGDVDVYPEPIGPSMMCLSVLEVCEEF